VKFDVFIAASVGITVLQEVANLFCFIGIDDQEL
jgi:hypothetical protein